MSFNIRYGTAPDGENAWPLRRAFVMRVIRDFDPAVIGVQEALRFQLDEVDAALADMREIGVGRDDGIEAGEYSAILFDTLRLGLLDHGTFWLSDTPDVPGSMTWGNHYPRLVTWAHLRDEAAAMSFYVLNTHWDHESQNARERSARQIMDWLASHAAGAPVLLMGDFNAGEDNAAFRRLIGGGANGVQLFDTFRALHPAARHVGTYHAFSGDRSGEKIDAVLASTEWAVTDAAIVTTSDNGRFPSDHFPVTATVTWRGAAAQHTRRPEPPAAMSSAMTDALAYADSALEAVVVREDVPGAVLVVTQGGEVIHERAFGYAQLYDYGMRRLAQPRPMHTSTLFDLASVTKVMATTYAIMLLVDRGLVDVDAPVYTYLPDFRGPHRDSITVRHLLTHSAGLYRWQPLYYHASTPAQTYDFIRTLPLQWGVGQERQYSDLGFMLLGYIIERVSGRTLDAFVREELHEPLGLESTTFVPTSRALSDFAATSHGNPYERRMVHDTAFGYDYDDDPDAWNGWRTYTLAGEVSDGNSWYAHGGVAGHAGLFSTGAELAVLLEVMLQEGTYEGRRILSPDVISNFTRKGAFGHGLGWQVPDDAPAGSFAHSGFTGTYVIGVPRYDLGIVLLTNRENVGVNDAGYYSDVGEFREPIIETIIAAAARSAP